MKFKKLEVSGFKSFADRLEIKFGNGVTAIVGPNGCGKSNVADSIRWVLGEQSAKLLRGSSMQDVIFNGTENRKSLSYCEVSLFFDNTEKLFPSLEYDEVVISRKLYRSGESDYYINKTQCRLKDITDLLRDGGMGREGYSIIGQGRIDELLSAKPEDRRAIFEEAAGISKFKARKIDAERKLGRTRENLVRINDILDEKSKQLEPLTRQSEAARKWLELRDRLKQYEINTYIYQYDTASEAKSVIGDRLQGVSEEIAQKQSDCDGAAEEYGAAMNQISSIDKTIEGLREELLQLTVGLEKQAGEVKLLNERLSYLNGQNERIFKENGQLDDDYRQTLAFIEEGEKTLASKRLEKEEAERAFEEVNARYLETVELLTAGEGEVESNHRAVLEAMDKLTDIRSNMSRLLAEKDGLAAASADLFKRIEGIQHRIEGDETKAVGLKAEIDERAAEKKRLTALIDSLYVKNNEALSIVNDCAAQLDKINARYYMAKSRHKMLIEMQQAFEGFAYSVKNLLSDAKKSREVSSRIEGVIAQIITVPPEFETAIEMALGNAVQNIVTRTEEDAKYLIEYLKRMKYGRVTFLPMTSVKPRRLDAGYEAAANGSGCYGAASRLIQFDAKYQNIIDGLLGNTVVVDDMDTAIALARKTQFSFKIVTKEGDIINPHGSITGGSKKNDIANIFSHDRELKEISVEIDTMSAKIDELTRARQEAAAGQEQTAAKIREVQEKIHNLEVALAGRVETYNKLVSSADEARREITQLTEERDKAAARIAAIDSDIGSVGELEHIITTKKQSASENGQERQQQFDALRKARDELHEKMTNLKVTVGTLGSDLLSIENEIRRLQANVVAITEKIELNNEQTASNDQIIAGIDAELNGMTTPAGEGDSDKVRQIRAKLGSLDDFKQELQENLAKADGRRMELMNLLQELHERKNREEMLLLKVDTDIEQMQQRIQEEYQLEYADCLPFKEENYDINKGVAESKRLKRQMDALGHVNLDSIEMCKEVYESYHEMDVQREDLVKAENDLMKIIKELSGEMLGRFTDQFEKIRTNFVKIFKELFDGGNADLILLENENPLEAGIEIVAQPPEKKLQSISLLSGGERALTAIAILFAILKLKPMPFCVLDEIEAALDDANAGRFAKYLRRFSEETQFIVITHRKPTMELADSLYGVTMEEKGVSKIVSVKLSEAVAQAEAASASA